MSILPSRRNELVFDVHADHAADNDVSEPPGEWPGKLNEQ